MQKIDLDDLFKQAEIEEMPSDKPIEQYLDYEDVLVPGSTGVESRKVAVTVTITTPNLATKLIGMIPGLQKKIVGILVSLVPKPGSVIELTCNGKFVAKIAHVHPSVDGYHNLLITR